MKKDTAVEMNTALGLRSARRLIRAAAAAGFLLATLAGAQEPTKGAVKRVELGGDAALEVIYIPPGKFIMGSTPEEKAWATGIEGGATPGTIREKYEGEPRPMQVKNGFWMGRTEVTVGQFRRFAEESGYVSDAEKPGGLTQVFDQEWAISGESPPYPWKSVGGKSWRDPGFGLPLLSNYPVVCVSWNDGRAFAKWLTERERRAGRLPAGLEYRLPTEAEWEYAGRGGSQQSHYFWWGNEFKDGEGRLNISAIDFLPGRNKTWPLGKAPWSDGLAFVAPVDVFGDKGRNGFGMADMCGNVWEIVLDHFDPTGGHEEPYFAATDPRPVCRGGNYYDVPGNARIAVRLGLRGPAYSDSRDGFRICLGVPRDVKVPGQ